MDYQASFQLNSVVKQGIQSTQHSIAPNCAFQWRNWTWIRLVSSGVWFTHFEDSCHISYIILYIHIFSLSGTNMFLRDHADAVWGLLWLLGGPPSRVLLSPPLWPPWPLFLLLVGRGAQTVLPMVAVPEHQPETERRNPQRASPQVSNCLNLDHECRKSPAFKLCWGFFRVKVHSNRLHSLYTLLWWKRAELKVQ